MSASRKPAERRTSAKRADLAHNLAHEKNLDLKISCFPGIR